MVGEAEVRTEKDPINADLDSDLNAGESVGCRTTQD
jgi:hypothetical protein